MELSPSERRRLNELAERTAAEDPEYVRRMATFGWHDPSTLGARSRRVLVPVVAAGAALVLGFVVTAVVTASLDGAGRRRRARPGLRR